METTQSSATGVTGGESQSPADLFEEAVKLALAEAGPVERASAITALLKAVEKRQKELTDVRRQDVLTLRETMTLAKVAAAIKLSVPRVDQIAKGQ
ncbi:hypothetical protein [Streptomyces alboflavus]|uniref:hypothetical protein n=1 Tax=Streptomyces alboflavus TaxID=67267 RepID=UPI000F658056|nr:hypothetical protein [Streptomyces alboflavus]